MLIVFISQGWGKGRAQKREVEWALPRLIGGLHHSERHRMTSHHKQIPSPFLHNRHVTSVNTEAAELLTCERPLCVWHRTKTLTL